VLCCYVVTVDVVSLLTKDCRFNLSLWGCAPCEYGSRAHVVWPKITNLILNLNWLLLSMCWPFTVFMCWNSKFPFFFCCHLPCFYLHLTALSPADFTHILSSFDHLTCRYWNAGWLAVWKIPLGFKRCLAASYPNKRINKFIVNTHSEGSFLLSLANLLYPAPF
jgi:hypothetical protein